MTKTRIAVKCLCFFLVFVGTLASTGCAQKEKLVSIDEVEREIDLRKCGTKKIPCPKAPKKCDRVWDNKPRDPAWGACEPPPAGGCNQVIFGRFNVAGAAPSELTKKYLGCPGYITLNLKKWTQKLNDEFVACAATDQLGATCNPKIKIVTKDGQIPDPPDSTTSIEICQLKACGCAVTRAGMAINIANPPCAPPKAGKPRGRPSLVALNGGAGSDECGLDDEECEACTASESAQSKELAELISLPAETRGATCGECQTLHANPCVGDGSACDSGADCCSGFCSDNEEDGTAGTCQPSEEWYGCLDQGEACDSACTGSDSCCEGSTCQPDPLDPDSYTCQGVVSVDAGVIELGKK